MGDDSDKKIVIDNVIGPEDGKDLLGCYFKAKNGGTYNFHDKDDSIKGRDITVGSDFTFRLDEEPDIIWHLSLGTNDEPLLTGTWRKGQDPAMADGEYQAQAGGSGEEEDTNAASAAGYTS